MKRIVALLLAVWMLGLVLTGCHSDHTNPDDPTEEDISVTAIVSSQLSNYAVVRPANADQNLVQSVMQFVSTVNELYDVSIVPKDDFFMENNPSYAIGEYEIIIGNANREETRAFLSDLRVNDWGYGMVGKKLIIAGETEAGTQKALETFTARFLSSANPIFFDNTNAFVSIASYSLDHVSLNGSELKNYSIVYPLKDFKSEKTSAQFLQDDLLERYGYTLPVIPDTEFTGGKAILIGETLQVTDSMKQSRTAVLTSDSEEMRYYIAGSGDFIWIDANDRNSISAGIKAFCVRIQPDGADKSCEIAVGEGKSELYVRTAVSSMSFNVYFVFDRTRAARVVTLIKNYMPDTVGLQEATPEWMSYLKSQLGDVYSFVGEGRNGGNNGEYTPVFYQKSKFTLIEGGTKWLSPTPDVPNSRFSQAELPRVMSYALLQCNSSGESFLHINTHLGTENDQMRENQLNILLQLIKNLPDVPCIVTGDFNWLNAVSLCNMMQKVGCVNSADVALRGNNQVSFPGGNTIIDYLFIRESNTGVDNYRVCNETIDGEYPSDHFPIFVEWYTIKP